MATPEGGVSFDVYVTVEADVGDTTPPVVIPQDTLLEAETVRPSI